jgi:hypothetical protein
MRHFIESIRGIFVTTWPSAIVAVAAWISIVVSLDPAGSYPSMPQGPGLTVDEIFNVEQGVYLVEQARALGWYHLIPGTSVEAFRPENGYNPDHPPLGRYWLGVHHQFTWWIAPPFQPDGPFVTVCARTGSATAFALTVWMIGAFVTFATPNGTFRGLVVSKDSRLGPGSGSPVRNSGAADPVSASVPPTPRHAAGMPSSALQGALTSLVLVLMPRVYGHAHLASLETMTNLTCTAAVLAVAAWWTGPAAPTRRAVVLAGIVLGFALLTKIQAILIPVPVVVWALIRWRQRAILPVLVWGLTALAVFFVAWPYLWLDPVGHLMEYLGRTTNRATLYCYYFGVRYSDTVVPWHYPFVMFAVTVPLGMHGLGVLAAGLGTMRRNFGRIVELAGESSDEDVWRNRLVLGCVAFPLIVFALPGVAVYDGERLFLTAFPPWAIFVGRGFALAYSAIASRFGIRPATISVSVLIALQLAANLRVHPCYLSYYNVAVGGLSGADKLGLEMNYWGDAMTRSMLESATAKNSTPQNSTVENHGFTTVEILPSLHQFQNDDLMHQSPILRSRRNPSPATGAVIPLRLAFRRRADLTDKIFATYPHPDPRVVDPRLAAYGAEPSDE